MESIAVQLPDDLNEFVTASVRAGGYRDAGEMVISLLSNLKDQIETPLTAEETTRLTSLRADILQAVDQADRGEVIRDFDPGAFLADRHRERSEHHPNA